MDQTCLVLMLVGGGKLEFKVGKASMFQSRCEVNLAYRTALAPNLTYTLKSRLLAVVSFLPFRPVSSVGADGG